jgi:hypothetical protein
MKVNQKTLNFEEVTFSKYILNYFKMKYILKY